jgi:phosphoenolpyruvate carboxylase
VKPHHRSANRSKSPLPQELPPLLRKLVRESVSTLGEVLQTELEAPLFLVIESIRTRMSSLRGDSQNLAGPLLSKTLSELSTLSASDRLRIASAYTLMLELMNACENAYRTYRLSQQAPLSPSPLPEAIVYVVTAHPTEARAPQNISVFYRIQNHLIEVLKRQGSVLDQGAQELRHLLAIAWRTAIVRERKPSVRDECEHIYSILLREETLKSILDLHDQLVPFYLRSWVGGDKDGHPGVDERALRQSLNLSRKYLLMFLNSRLRKMIQEIQELPSTCLKAREITTLLTSFSQAQAHLKWMRTLTSSDGQRARELRAVIHLINDQYVKAFGAQHPELRRILSLLRVFPGLVVPLELRESSDILMSYPKKKNLPIVRMIAQIGTLAKGGDPRWYARGFIISMAESFEHIQKAAQIVSDQLGATRIPIVPLFEQEEALRNANQIISKTLKNSTLKKAAHLYWNGSMEIMVGYSDSAKEAGVFRSRLLIAQTMTQLEKTCKRARVKAIFFHGSGGSVDRGGGSIQDQASWWPDGALRLHKATLQGEMG